MVRQVVKAALAALVAAAIAGPALADGPVYKSWLGIAIKGYDAVAYHTEGRPVEGSDEFEAEWNGATWRFANAEHRDLFVADPERYAPAYGGYCAYGVTQGVKPKIDPDAWTIVDDRLYLNLSKSIQERWEQDIPGYIAKADAIWPTIRDD
jgi:YHS domain-containing protein